MKTRRIVSTVLALVLIVGVAWLTTHLADRYMRDDFLQQVQLVSRAIDREHIHALSGTEVDLARPDYQRLKEQLASIRSSSQQSRFLYLMGRKPDGTVFFFVDSESVNSKEYSPPGQVFAETSADLLRVFDEKTSLVEGPVTDSWGTWISALVPLTDPQTGDLIAVLGMDIDARTWRLDVAARVVIPVGLLLLLCIGAVAVIVSSRQAAASPEPILRRLLLPLAVMVVLMALGTGTLLWRQYRLRLDGEMATNTADVLGDLRVALDQQARGLDLAAQFIAADTAVQEALREGRADRLLPVWKPRFEKLHRENNLTHFSFFDTNRVCLLRFMKPDQHGDIINRFTALAAERTRKSASGIELGPLGTFTLRTVRPITEGTRLVGYVELGKEIEDALSSLSGNPLAVVIRKEQLNRSTWEEGMRLLGREADWDRLPHSVVIYASRGSLPDAFAAMADSGAFDNAARRNWDWETACNGKDWRLSAAALQDASGTEVGGLLVMRDITAAKAAFRRLLIFGGTAGAVLLALLLGFIYVLLCRTDAGIRAQHAALQESEAKYRALVQNMQIGVVAHGPDTSILYSNPMASHLLGLTPDQMRGKTAIDPEWCFIREDGTRMPLEEYPVNRALSSDGPSETLVLGILRPDCDSPTWVQCDTHTNRAVDGQMQQVVVTFFDVTARKRSEAARVKLEEQLRHAQKMESVGRLAGGVAHDFNNMLSVILGHAQMALEQMKSDQPVYASLVEIDKAAQRSADLTRQLLAFGRKQTIVPKVLDLNAIVEGMLKMLERLIGEDIHLVWRPKTGLWPVKVDPSQIDQILANLCVNARDAIAGTGRLTIETGMVVLSEDNCAAHAEMIPGEYVLLAVSDSGCGMDDETLEHLFEPFFTTKETGKGTGLGLATVYGIVKQNQGAINVYSEPGQGTTFKIYLPRYAGEEGPARVERAITRAPGGQETVLLVEDEPAILKITAVMLEKQGYTVLAAKAPAEAQRLALEYSGTINLLLTDVVMPGMNGRELAGNLLASRPNLKCLFMSGYTADVIAHHGVLDPCMHFIQKPFSLRDIAVKVREVLDDDGLEIGHA